MNAKDNIAKRLDELFADAPHSKAAWELQEELLANCMERYNDLTSQGMPPEQAERTVIENIGNIDELIAALPESDRTSENSYETERRQRSAVIVTIAVGLYILAGAILIASTLLADLFFGELVLVGFVIALLVCIVPTCLLVYNAYRWPAYNKKEDTVVEEFKEWSNDSKKSKSLRAAVSSLIWTLILIAYFVVSFTTFAWHLTWIIFLVGACLEAIVTLAFHFRELR